MFLVGKQKSRFADYENLSGSEKATFTFRLANKIRMFLDDVPEVNGVLKKIPRKSHKKAFREKHIYALFDLLEEAIISVGVLPTAPDPQTGKFYVGEEFEVVGKSNVVGIYKISRPATQEEILRWESISTQIKRLQEIMTEPHKIPKDELTPNAFRAMIDDMTK